MLIVRIGDQIIDGDDQIAIYDTVTDRFVDLAGCHTADDRADLLLCMELDGWPMERRLRVWRLLPDDWDVEGRGLPAGGCDSNTNVMWRGLTFDLEAYLRAKGQGSPTMPTSTG